MISGRFFEQHASNMPMPQIVSDFLDSGCCSLPFVTVTFGVLLIIALTLVALSSNSDEQKKTEPPSSDCQSQADAAAAEVRAASVTDSGADISCSADPRAALHHPQQT